MFNKSHQTFQPPNASGGAASPASNTSKPPEPTSPALIPTAKQAVASTALALFMDPANGNPFADLPSLATYGSNNMDTATLSSAEEEAGECASGYSSLGVEIEACSPRH